MDNKLGSRELIVAYVLIIWNYRILHVNLDWLRCFAVNPDLYAAVVLGDKERKSR